MPGVMSRSALTLTANFVDTTRRTKMRRQARQPATAQQRRRDRGSTNDGAILSDVINDYGNFIIADCRRERTPQDDANLALIVRAVNSLVI